MAKIMPAIALARSSGGTARSPIAFTGEVERNRNTSATKPTAKNVVDDGIKNTSATSGAAITMLFAHTASSTFVPRFVGSASHASPAVACGTARSARSLQRPPITVPTAPPTTVTAPKYVAADDGVSESGYVSARYFGAHAANAPIAHVYVQ